MEQAAEIQEIEQTVVVSEASSEKGKEMEITERKGITRPPLNFIAILKDSETPIDKSSPEKLRDQLYAGIFLKRNKLKFFVDKGSNKNGFVLFARQLFICWAEVSNYWIWTEEKNISGGDIEVAELKKAPITWLEIFGKIDTIDLSPQTLYEIVLVIKIEDPSRWDFMVRLVIVTPSKKWLSRFENLKEKPSNEWFEILVGEYRTSPGDVGRMELRMEEYTSNLPKFGISVRCAIIRPK